MTGLSEDGWRSAVSVLDGDPSDGALRSLQAKGRRGLRQTIVIASALLLGCLGLVLYPFDDAWTRPSDRLGPVPLVMIITGGAAMAISLGMRLVVMSRSPRLLRRQPLRPQTALTAVDRRALVRAMWRRVDLAPPWRRVATEMAWDWVEDRPLALFFVGMPLVLCGTALISPSPGQDGIAVAALIAFTPLTVTNVRQGLIGRRHLRFVGADRAWEPSGTLPR